MLFLTLSAHAAVHYVDVNCAAPAPPYTNWDTAAQDIQSAVDVAVAGDTVFVTNGTYATGGRTVNGYALTNRVVINKAVTVQSVNGPLATIIQGYQVPGTTNGDSAVRGVYLTNNATLIGFTVTNGATLVTITNVQTRPGTDLAHEGSGGGLWCEAASAVVSNCVITRNWACVYGGGGVYGGTLNNCTLTANWAAADYGMGVIGKGAGAYSATLINCLLAHNAAGVGGAAYSCTLNNCTLISNSSKSTGGGTASCTLSNCTLTGNSATQFGGGAYYGTLYNCALTGNSAGASWPNGGGGAHSATLNNCTLAQNSCTRGCGGGAHNCTLNNSVLIGNWVFPSDAGWGGGACNSTLNNCLLTGNSGGVGGGANGGTLNNCTLVGNSAPSGGEAGGAKGGGVASATLNNCIVWSNMAGWVGANNPTSNYLSCTMSYCCTKPLATNGLGNITNSPAFVDYASGNLRLQTNSPCINAGNNAYAPGSTDLDGRPRIVGGTVDIGAYEFQPGISGSFLGWLQQYGLPTDGSADCADCDHDGMNNWLEFCAGTNPTNSLSALRLISVTHNASGLSVTWQSVTNQTYLLERSTGMNGPASFLTLATNIPGQAGTTTYTDTNAVGSGPFFYRVGVQTGAWQMPSGGSIISYAWLQQYGVPTDGAADYADPDHDGMNNWQEWRAGTDPTNGASALRMLSATGAVSGVTVAWSSVAGRSYSLERATNLGALPAFSLLGSNIAGLAGTTTFTDTNALGAAPRFYRVRVE